VLSEIKKKM